MSMEGDMSLLAPAHCAVVLVNHGGLEHTLACLRALSRLERAPGWVVVADNSPKPDEARHLFEGWRAIAAEVGQPAPERLDDEGALPGAPAVLLALRENRGFAAANNAILKSLSAERGCRAFWLLNNDAEPTLGALSALCDRLNEQPDAGICGSTLVRADAPDRLQCAAGGTFTPWLAATRHLAEGASLARLPARAEMESRLDYVIGASLLIRREVLESVGFLPEEHFLYCEDVDFCLSVRRAGFGLAWAPDSVVAHREGGSSGARSGPDGGRPERSRLVDYLSVRNRFHLVRKHRPAALPVALLALPFILANRLRRGQADRCGLMLKAVFHALTGRLGRPGGAP